MVAAGRKYKPLPDYEEPPGTRRPRSIGGISSPCSMSAPRPTLFGVSFDFRGRANPSHDHPRPRGDDRFSPFPIQVEGVDLTSQGYNVKAFTVPQISWEPVLNLSQPHLSRATRRLGPNYYPNDGGPSSDPQQQRGHCRPRAVAAGRTISSTVSMNDPDTFAAYAFLTLPFGLKALAVLQDHLHLHRRKIPTERRAPDRGRKLLLNAEEFEGEITGGLQLQLNAGEALIQGQGDMFRGSTVQLNNVLNLAGQSTGASTLGRSSHELSSTSSSSADPPMLIRGREGASDAHRPQRLRRQLLQQLAEPQGRLRRDQPDAASTFSVGRCAREVIQVKSMIYPWGIQVVRTITSAQGGERLRVPDRLRMAWRRATASSTSPIGLFPIPSKPPEWRCPLRSRFTPASSRAYLTSRTSSRPKRSLSPREAMSLRLDTSTMRVCTSNSPRPIWSTSCSRSTSTPMSRSKTR